MMHYVNLKSFIVFEIKQGNHPLKLSVWLIINSGNYSSSYFLNHR